ncbi:LacI family DNA-binding transcriptional regulator [Microbacterium murale]|uniref:DNA-binding LacI/PurR family transcriptional regulator n=1 Tax=Microbacterium murale TaxID=1081040 RepID=A0ABU0PAM6_9MICO|nr:LacI family DNA-binding transcriptional regulator [Microbacterium murale]MDQ0644391.1 DNA-binding LacI/PurR family transcriptional regulator [Microbacterium murale]
MARVTLADVAARVGVSAKSVSNVVNGTGWVSNEVRDRILEAIDDLGYRPNLAARQLRNGRSGLIALVIPDLREPYFAEFAARFVTTAQHRSLTVLVAQTGGDRAAELAMMAGEGFPALDGIVMSPLRLTPDDLTGRSTTPPLIVIGEQAEALIGPSVHHVGIDNVSAAAAATEHLIGQGCRRIAVVGLQDSGPSATSQLRFDGYRQALTNAGIEIDTTLLASVGHFNRAEGSVAVQRLLDAGVDFDGLLCFSDSLALGALYTLGSARIPVPASVRVMGFDGIEEGRFHIPTFSTVDHGVEQASDTILDILAAPNPSPGTQHRVPYRILAR